MKLAIIQPRAHRAPDDEQNVADAVSHIAESAAAGADFVVFPETYPGPLTAPLRFDPGPALLEAAARHRVHVVYGTLEATGDDPRSVHNLICLATPDGERALAYRRTHPEGPWIYAHGRTWDFDYVAGDELPVVETDHGVVGLAMCSEVYVPEVSRALALQGAELIFIPAGDDKHRLFATWRTLVWARAIENLAIVATTQNVYGEERGLAMVAAPEEILLEETAPGSYLVDVDLDAARELRAGIDGQGSGEHRGTKAGLLTQWRRPDLYERLASSTTARV
ncbi:MAG TPA: carbon-nitrogen hydrolase family protein [Gaiellaceae bacterium]|nr:carbon-nitrogen hydrolase family protein [Gaiellaceae bacterium]